MEILLTFFESITLLAIVKLLVLLLLAVYGIFAFLMMRQTGSMTRAISMRDDYIIRLLAIMHFVAAVLVLGLAILLL